MADEDMHKLTDKQQAFVDNYFICGGNASEAARRAGYANRTALQASDWLNPKKTHKYKAYLAAAIEKRRQELKSQRTADATEVLEYLTRVMRGKQEDETFVIEGTGDGCSEARKMNVKVGTRDRNKAAELLGRVMGIFSDKLKLEGSVQVPVIIDDIESDDDG